MSFFKSCFGSSNDGEGGIRSRDIDRALRVDEKRLAREVKLLLLGAGDSGKSTVLKQMKLIYAQGFSTEERCEWRPVIFTNIIQSFSIIHEAMEDLEIELADPNSPELLAEILKAPELTPREPFPVALLEPVRALWQDAGIREAVRQGNSYALQDNLEYFFDELDRLFAPDYVPTDQDVLRCRQRTTGIIETVFELESLIYRMVDVGGQRSERKKWIHCFENVNCLLFLVAISGYDVCLVEDKDSNQMREALMLWESVVNSHWFAKTAMILFLNKTDLFRTKIKTSHLVEAGFPDYSGPQQDAKAAGKYFLAKFKSLNRDPTKEIYAHFTNATDTNLLKITMGSVKDMIIQRNLKSLIM